MVGEEQRHLESKLLNIRIDLLSVATMVELSQSDDQGDALKDMAQFSIHTLL